MWRPFHSTIFLAEPIHFWFWKHIVIMVECIIHIIWSCGVWAIAGTLKGSRKKWGGQVCAIAYFLRGGKEGSVLDEAVTYFLEEQQIVKENSYSKKKKRRLVSSSIGPVSQAAPGTWEKFIMNVSGKMSYCFCYLFLNPAIGYTICFWDSARWNTGHRGNIASEVSEEHICTCKQL